MYASLYIEGDQLYSKLLTDNWQIVGAFHAAKKFPPPGWTHMDDTTSIWDRERKSSMRYYHSNTAFANANYS